MNCKVLDGLTGIKAKELELDDIDIVVEGTAQKVTDTATLERVASLTHSLGWPARASAERSPRSSAPQAPDADRGTSMRSLQSPPLESRPTSRTVQLAGAFNADRRPRSEFKNW